MLCGSVGAFHGKEGKIQVLAGLAPSSQTGSLLNAPWQTLPERKIQQK